VFVDVSISSGGHGDNWILLAAEPLSFFTDSSLTISQGGFHRRTIAPPGSARTIVPDAAFVFFLRRTSGSAN
jgi:hypothetical protein